MTPHYWRKGETEFTYHVGCSCQDCYNIWLCNGLRKEREAKEQKAKP
jgi:hypothetical protein